MKTLIIAALLVGSATFAMAQSNAGGAWKMSPGHQMQNSSSTSRGASEMSPGDRMQDKGMVGQSCGTTRGASEYSPGDRMHDKNTRENNANEKEPENPSRNATL